MADLHYTDTKKIVVSRLVEDNPAIKHWSPPLKVHKIPPDPNLLDDVMRFKKTWIGRFYEKNLKKYPLILKLSNALWRKFHPTYTRIRLTLCSPSACAWRPIVKLVDYVNSSNLPSIQVFETEKIDTPPPRVVPSEERALASPHSFYEFPPIYVAELSNARACGGSNLVLMADSVICHDLYDFARDYTSEELHGRHVIDPKNKRVRLLRHDTKPVHIPVAAVFLDACSSNYAHWLTEVLPRIAVFCSLGQYKRVPIIVDDGLHPNIMESLSFIVGSDREIFTLPVGRAIDADTLYITSVAGYVPFERRKTKLGEHSHGVFSSRAFHLLDKKLLRFQDRTPFKALPKKIYLRRNSTLRNVVNADEIERMLVRCGYTIIDPENLTFFQQCALFRSADEIVGPTGAAFSNLIFARPDVRVQIFISNYVEHNYWYWQNMALASGKTVRYVIGNLAEGEAGVHGNYYIDSRFLFTTDSQGTDEPW